MVTRHRCYKTDCLIAVSVKFNIIRGILKMKSNLQFCLVQYGSLQLEQYWIEEKDTFVQVLLSKIQLKEATSGLPPEPEQTSLTSVPRSVVQLISSSETMLSSTSNMVTASLDTTVIMSFSSCLVVRSPSSLIITIVHSPVSFAFI